MASGSRVPATTIDGLLRALLILLRTVGHTLESEAVKAAVGGRLSASKVQVLRLLRVRGGRTATQVSRFLTVSKPAVTQLIDSLVRRKLVVRRTGKRDRREVDLYLTEKGRQMSRSVFREQRQVLRTATRQAAGPHAREWIKTLGEVTDALARAGRAYERFCLQCDAHFDGTCVLDGGDAPCPFRQCVWPEAQPAEQATGRSTNRAKTGPQNRRRR